MYPAIPGASICRTLWERTFLRSLPASVWGFSEYCYIMPGAHVFKVPEELSDECAMLAEIMSCSWNVDKAKEFYSFSGEGFQVNDTVVVIGVGPLGMSHLIKAHILGAGKTHCHGYFGLET